MNKEHPPSVFEERRLPEDLEGGNKHGPGLRWFWLIIAILLAVVAYYFWPKSGSQQSATTSPVAVGARRRGAGTVPVVAVKARKGDIGVYIIGLGAVTPDHTVTVKTQISGYLMNVFYKQGEIVRKGALLAQIDPRPYQVMLEQAEAGLARDEANANNARVDLKRYQTLIEHNAIPEQQLTTQMTTVKQADATIKTDQAQIDAAKLNLAYCQITAPITGRVGLRLVDPGNYVAPGDSTGLAVITQVQPITVIFTIAEDQLPAVFKRWHAGQRLKVDAYDRSMTTKIATGYLTSIDNQIDPTTGTVKLRATFNNNDSALFPNQFVNARLLVEEKHGVTLAPTAVVQQSAQSNYVYVVKQDSTVTVRQIKTGVTEGNESEIISGLSPGEVAVMTGVDKLQEGSKVNAHIEDNPGQNQ